MLSERVGSQVTDFRCFFKIIRTSKIYFILFGLVIYIQLALWLNDAWKQGTANLLCGIAMVIIAFYLHQQTIRADCYPVDGLNAKFQ